MKLTTTLVIVLAQLDDISVVQFKGRALLCLLAEAIRPLTKPGALQERA